MIILLINYYNLLFYNYNYNIYITIYMDNYFISTLIAGIFICYMIIPAPDIVFKYKKDKCYKIVKEEVEC